MSVALFVAFLLWFVLVANTGAADEQALSDDGLAHGSRSSDVASSAEPIALSTPVSASALLAASSLPEPTVAASVFVSATATPVATATPLPTATALPTAVPQPTAAPADPADTVADDASGITRQAQPVEGDGASTDTDSGTTAESGDSPESTNTPEPTNAPEPTSTPEPEPTVAPTPTPALLATQTPVPAQAAVPAQATAPAAATTLTPVPAPTAVAYTAAAYLPGTYFVDASDGLVVRDQPGGEAIDILSGGTAVVATGNAGQTVRLWVEISSPTAGWVAAEFLASAPVPTPTPHAIAVAAGGPTPDQMAALANCESGGNYQINTGNGYYGAYQFAISTWDSVAAQFYPHLVGVLPSDASAADQDAMMVALHSTQGFAPWPGCRASLGLP